MNLPFVIIGRTKLEEIEKRLLDLERHFVTRRDAHGAVTETLADVPVERRNKLKPSTKGLSWEQKRLLLEQTDGGRNLS